MSVEKIHPSAKPQRNAVFEILRIAAMLLIVARHFYGHGHWNSVSGGANEFFINLTSALFNPSVNIFVMISAYFMCGKDDMKINFKRLARLWLSVFFYSTVLFTVFTATGIYEFNVRELISSLFPVAMGKYWFVSAYFLMVVASPLLNAIIKRLDKAQFSMLCIAIMLVAALEQTGAFGTIGLQCGHSGIWFCLLYLLTAYIKKYDIRIGRTAFIISTVVFAGVTMFVTFVWKNPAYTSVVTLFMSYYVLLSAKNIKITGKRASKAICFISKLTFGVYLISDSNEMRGYMYENIFHSSRYFSSDYAYLIFMGFILLTFTVCAAAELIRQIGFNIVAKLFRRLFGEKADRASARLKNFFAGIMDKINATDTAYIPQQLES